MNLLGLCLQSKMVEILISTIFNITIVGTTDTDILTHLSNLILIERGRIHKMFYTY